MWHAVADAPSTVESVPMHGKSEDRDDYQLVPRPVAAMARDLPDGHHIPPHHHRRAQLIYGTSGAVTVATDQGTWVVPATLPSGSPPARPTP